MTSDDTTEDEVERNDDGSDWQVPPTPRSELLAEIDRLRAENERLRQAECGHCGRSLPPDGDCHGCECDRLRASVADLEGEYVADVDRLTQETWAALRSRDEARADLAGLAESPALALLDEVGRLREALMSIAHGGYTRPRMIDIARGALDPE